MTWIEGWDPGGATGFASGVFTDDRPFTLTHVATLTPGGVKRAMRDWQYTNGVIRVVEDFRLRSSNRFTADLQGDRLIGAMDFAEFMGITDTHIVWQMPYDKKHVTDQVLKDGGLWPTPRDVNHNTARHVNDAIIHILKYLKVDLKHEPTIEKYWGGQ